MHGILFYQASTMVRLVRVNVEVWGASWDVVYVQNIKSSNVDQFPNSVSYMAKYKMCLGQNKIGCRWAGANQPFEHLNADKANCTYGADGLLFDRQTNKANH